MPLSLPLFFARAKVKQDRSLLTSSILPVAFAFLSVASRADEVKPEPNREPAASAGVSTPAQQSGNPAAIDAGTGTSAAAPIGQPPETPQAETETMAPAELTVQSGRLIQLSAQQRKAKAQFQINAGELRVGTPVFALGNGGATCEGKIAQAKQQLAILDFSGCAGFSRLAVGSQVSTDPSTLVDTSRRTTKRRSRSIRFGGKLYYDTANQMTFNNLSVSSFGATGSGNVSYQMNTAFGLGLELLMDRENSFGFIAGVGYELSRNVNSASLSLTSNGQTINVNNPTSGTNINFLILYADLLYRFEHPYLIAGFNYATPGGSLPAAMGTPTGSFGGQLGGGYYIGEYFAIELTGRLLSFTAPSTTVSTNTYNLGSTQIMSANLTLKAVY